MLRTLRHHLTERDAGLRYDGKILVEDVRLDASGPEHMLEILFRDDACLKYLFGWRYPATEADSDALEEGIEHLDLWEKGLREPEEAEIWASTFVLTNFEEQIEAAGHGLPPECDSEVISTFCAVG